MTQELRGPDESQDAAGVFALPQIDPLLALELLPPKIAARERRVADLAIDISIARENPYVTGQELGELVRELRLHQFMLEAYRRRLNVTRFAAGGQ